MQVRYGRASKGTNSVGGRIAMTVFGLLFGSFGLFIAFHAARDGLAERATRQWQPTPCTIEKTGIVDDGDGYQLQLAYQYAYLERAYAGTRRTLKGGLNFDDVATGQRLLSRYRAGATATCYVNPAAPEQAVLERGGSWLAVIGPVLFCSVFVLVGYGLVVGAWVGGRRNVGEEATGGRRTPVTARANRVALPILFGVVFLAIGLGVTYGTFVRPLQRQVEARDWVPVEAVVTKSAVRVHSGDDTTTYSVYIAYRYDFNGQAWQGDRYRFTSGSSSGRFAKQQVVSAHPVGRKITVYVDPADPAESVILRDAGRALYLGLIPLIFALVGAAALVFAIRSARRQRSAGVTDHGRAAPMALRRPTQSFTRASGHAKRIVGMLAAALFWNGIVSVFLHECVSQWQRGGHPVFLSLFLVPFVLIGAGLVGGFIYQILRVFNPRVALERPNCTLAPGVITQLGFRGTGNLRRLARLAITVHGHEHATYQRGTNSVTDTHEFFAETLLDSRDPMLMEQGSVRLALPTDAMHSFKSAHNRIAWTITVAGQVPHWPDLAETYELNIRPREERP